MTAKDEYDWGDFPQNADPKAQAQFLLKMLEALARQGTVEASRIRSALFEIITQYQNATDKAQAKEVLKAQVAALEISVYELVLKTTRAMRDRYIHEARKLGAKEFQGYNLRVAAEGFTHLVNGMSKMLQAAKDNDVSLRKEANEFLDRARAALQGLGS